MIDMSTALMAIQKPLSMESSSVLGAAQEAAKGTPSLLTSVLREFFFWVASTWVYLMFSKICSIYITQHQCLSWP